MEDRIYQAGQSGISFEKLQEGVASPNDSEPQSTRRRIPTQAEIFATKGPTNEFAPFDDDVQAALSSPEIRQLEIAKSVVRSGDAANSKIALESLIEDYGVELAEFESEVADYINNYKPQGTVVNPATNTRHSQNDQWYRDFYRKNGKAPNKADKLKIIQGIVGGSINSPISIPQNYKEIRNIYLAADNAYNKVFTDSAAVDYDIDESGAVWALDGGTDVSATESSHMQEKMPYRKSEKTENDTNESNEFGLKKYSNHQIDNWKDSKRIVVYENKEQLEKFIDDAISNTAKNTKLYFGQIPAETALHILEETDVDLNGYNCAIQSNEVRKILIHSHGNADTEALRGQRAITPEDIANIPFMLSSPSKVYLSDTLYEEKPLIIFEKTINTNTVMKAYVSVKHKDLSVLTMYARYKKRALPPQQICSKKHPCPIRPKRTWVQLLIT